jgi:hypothetical protein
MVSFIIPVKDGMTSTYVMMETNPVKCEFRSPLVPANPAYPVIPNNPSRKGFRTFLTAFALAV